MVGFLSNESRVINFNNVDALDLNGFLGERENLQQPARNRLLILAKNCNNRARPDHFKIELCGL